MTSETGAKTATETQEGSAVIRISENLRQCHLTTLLPLSSTVVDEQGNHSRTPISFRVYLEAASYLALKHFNDRDPRVLPKLNDLLLDCDVQLTVDMRDTQFSPIEAARQLQNIYLHSDHSIEVPLPFALLGAARSAVSQTVAILSGSYEIPQMSATSTSVSLDNKEVYPFFARTVPSNAGDAKALILYFERLKVTHFGVIFIQDSFGGAYHDYIKVDANKRGMAIISAPFNDGDNGSISKAIERIRKSQVKYIFGVFNPRTWKSVFREAIKAGILGRSGYTWILSDASAELTQPGFTLDRVIEGDIARAIHGTGVLSLHVPTNSDFDDALTAFENNITLQHEFISKHQDASIFHGFDWTYPGMVMYQYLHYDAVVSLGIAACRAENYFFTGPEFYQTLLGTEFEGVSGYVSFLKETGTRNADQLRYQVANVLLSDSTSTPDSYGFASNITVEIDFRSVIPIVELLPFIYADNSTIPPRALPPLEEELNLITRPILSFGLSLCAATIACAIGWCIWTWRFRNTDVVRASQPIFLCQLCLGTVILAASIIPMSMQEPRSQSGLKIACMATPWLLSVGFTTTFAALFSKTMRLNKLFGNGNAFRRVQVKPQDVMLPFAILLTINLACLVIWTIFAPLAYRRIQVDNFDSFGRSVESYGTCYRQERRGGKIVQISVIAALVVVNFTALLFANYQCYLARDIPSDFNESYYIAVANAGILEAMMLGGPILLMVRDSPSANFLVKSLLIVICCCTILFPIFVPKAHKLQVRNMRRRHAMSDRRLNVGRESGLSFTPAVELSRASSPEIAQCRVGGTMVTRNDDFWVHRRSMVTNRIAVSIGNRSIIRRHDVILSHLDVAVDDESCELRNTD
jgi:Receptor family ligand binding region/7 transmembrane sweet-taste receptor of 3 GCPR